MTSQDREKKILLLVKEVLPPDPARPPLSRATKLLADPVIDSLTMASLGFLINENFGISVDRLATLLPKFDTVDDVLRLVEEELNAG
jgi:acyl carrier protein